MWPKPPAPFVSFSFMNFSTAVLTYHLQNNEPVVLCQFFASFAKPSHLPGSTGALLHSTGAETPSTGSFLQEGQRAAPQKEKFDIFVKIRA